MAKVSKKTATATAPAAKGKTTTAAKTNGAAENAEAKRAARQELEAKQMAEVVKRFVNGDEKAEAVAKDLNVSKVRVMILAGMHRVQSGEVPAITAKNDEALVQAIAKERSKADEFSSWGWLAVRSGKSEPWIKTQLEEAGLYTPRTENIASTRKAARPAAAPKATGGKTAGGKKRVAGNA